MHQRISKVMLLALFTLLVSMALPKNTYAADIKRLEGDDKYNTIVKIAQEGWPSSENVILAYGEDFPDALSAAPLSKQLNAPILLTDKDALNAYTKDEIKRLNAKSAYIIGGYGVISRDIESTLKNMGLSIQRLYGNDRYETDLAVVNYLSANYNMNKEVIVATGENFPDALSAASISGILNMPILLLPKDNVLEGTKEYMKNYGITKSYIAGGTGVVSDAQALQIVNPVRIGGSTRYDTNVSVLNNFKNDINFNKVYITTGENYPYALAGSALAWKTKSPMLITAKSPGLATYKYIQENISSISGFTVLGEENSVPSDVVPALLNAEYKPNQQDTDKTDKQEASGNSLGQRIVDTAKKYVGVPYVWGGASPSGFDSSGLVYYSYKQNGIQLPRGSSGMFQIGTSISKEDLIPGDIVFFQGYKPGPSHATIYAGNGEFVHSPTTGKTVSVERLLDNPYYWIPRYYGARRMIDSK